MAESLGQAVLELRTDDSNFTRDLDVAEQKARGLGNTFGQTSNAARTTSGRVRDVADATDQAASALGREAAAANAAAPALNNHSAAVGRLGDTSRRTAMQQKLLLFQLNDIGVSLASGMNPLMVAVQQGSQISQIYGPGEGGMGRAFKETGVMIGNVIRQFPLLTGAVALGGAAIAGMTYEINQASSETVSFGDVALATWQVIADGLATILKPVIDAVAPWFQAAWDGVVAGVKWAGNLIINSFRAAFEDIKFIWANFPDVIGAAVTGAVNLVIDGINAMVRAGTAGMNALIRGINSASQAMGADKAFEMLGFSGAIPEVAAPQIERMANPAAGRLAQKLPERNAAVNRIMSEDPLGQFFDAVTDRAVQNARNRKKKDEKDKADAPERAAKPDDSEKRFEADLDAIMLQTIRARQALATTIEERYRLERQEMDIMAARARRDVADNDKLTAAQKAKLTAQLDIKETLERELINRKEAGEMAREALQIANASVDNERDLGERALRLARTREQRRAIELRLLALSYQQERAELEAVLASKSATDAQKKIAAARLRILGELEQSDRNDLDQQYESPMERYRREVGDVRANLNDSLEEVEVEGLRSLEQGLTDVITGARSLGDVFDDIANQIIAALVKIAVQQLIIMPLLNALGGGGGGGGGGLAGLLQSFAGGFSTGGVIPEGSFGIVGEKGPEPVIATPRGALVRPNSSLSSSSFRSAGPSVSMPISIDATGADPAGLERVRQSVDRLRAEMPGTILQTVQDAGDRRLISARNWR